MFPPTVVLAPRHHRRSCNRCLHPRRDWLPPRVVIHWPRWSRPAA